MIPEISLVLFKRSNIENLVYNSFNILTGVMLSTALSMLSYVDFEHC